jgi:hypothetical protein
MEFCKALLPKPFDPRQPFGTLIVVGSDMYSSSLQLVSLVAIKICLYFGMKARAHQLDSPSTADVAFRDEC